MITKGLYSVAQSSTDSDLIVLKKGNVVIGSGQIRVSAIRAYLVGFQTAQYTLNAAIRIARFVANDLGLNYNIPTDLSGTETDNRRIIPDQITLGIVLLQAFHEVTVDGLPGADFIRRVMKLHQDIKVPVHCRNAFMDESENQKAITDDGQPIVMPDFNAGEAAVYDFLREITLVRNGLWSDRPYIVNLTGIRLVKGATNLQWDDTISACWVDSEGNKTARVYTATTEPGNRKDFKTMLPQTIIFVPGYHQGKLPAMRGHRLVVSDPTILSPHRLLYTVNDSRGLNLHPGGTTGAMKNLVRYKFPVGASTESEFRAVLVFMEIFEIISRWGLDPVRPAWDNLVAWAELKALRAGVPAGDKIPVFQDGKIQPIKQISIATSRGWLAQHWSADRVKLLKILRSVDPNFMPPANFNQLNTSGLVQLITEQHIVGIVLRQCDYFFDMNEVDGLAGNTYLSLLNGTRSADGALARQANVDFSRLVDLLQMFNSTHPILTPGRRDYVKKIITQTLEERAKIIESEAQLDSTDTSQQIRERVGNWSILCQVVFGPEKFYEMMRHTLGHALQSGQRRWYYTLIEETSVPEQV